MHKENPCRKELYEPIIRKGRWPYRNWTIRLKCLLKVVFSNVYNALYIQMHNSIKINYFMEIILNTCILILHIHFYLNSFNIIHFAKTISFRTIIYKSACERMFRVCIICPQMSNNLTKRRCLTPILYKKCVYNTTATVGHLHKQSF